jgi:cytochrome c biogenesis protein
LPFAVELKKFIVEYYSTGMPKLFASDIVIHDIHTGEQVPARVEVNHPARYKGVEIYQSSFDDGGSTVKLKAYPVKAAVKPFEVQGVIGGKSELLRGQGLDAEKLTLEYTALRVINVENLGGNTGANGGVDVRKVDLKDAIDARLGAANRGDVKKNLRNVGPSITYKLRDASGQAREFHNYMLPVDTGDGVPVFLLGARDSPSEGFRYMRIPADDAGGLEGFARLRDALNDPVLREAAVKRYAQLAVDPKHPGLGEQLAASANRALGLFTGAEAVKGGKTPGGLQAVADFIENNVPESERNKAGEVLIRILNGVLFELVQMSREQSGLKPLEPNEKTQGFMSQAVLALSDVQFYPAPMALQLVDFTQVQASVFQVARAPGKNIVYLGCALLILGIFAMLYVRERRLWVWVTPADAGAGEGSHATMALSTNRKTMDTDREFDDLQLKLIGAGAQPQGNQR